jgi:uncharacterized protein (TIGR02453 family)
MAFKGWKAEALEFFEGLEADNSKKYWEAHKHEYEQLVRAPMEELLAELGPKHGETKIFRPYRDIRFSKDKSPYKTNIAAVLGEGYLHLSAHEFGLGSGMWEMAPDQLERYREAVDDQKSGVQLTRIVEKIRSGGAGVVSHGELKTAPKGYPKDHPRLEFLRYKGIIAWREWPTGAWLGTAKAKDRVVEFLKLSKPLGTWLDAHVGASTAPERMR